MLLYLKMSGSNQQKTKTSLIDCCLSLRTNFLTEKVSYLPNIGQPYSANKNLCRVTNIYNNICSMFYFKFYFQQAMDAGMTEGSPPDNDTVANVTEMPNSYMNPGWALAIKYGEYYPIRHNYNRRI